MKRLILILCMVFASSGALAAHVQQITTPSGFTLWLIEDRSLPLIAANIIFTQSGTAYDPEGKEGRTNLTASLLLEGAGSRDANSFNQLVEEKAIRLNVGADSDTLGASLQSLSEHSELAFSLLADALIRPRFDKDAITRAREKMLTLLIEQSESPYYKLERGWQQTIYGNHPYAKNPIGSAESLNELTAEDFKDYTRRYLSRENMIISVVGDIDAATISRLVDQHFSALPAQAQRDVALEEFTLPTKANQSLIKHDVPQTIVKFGFMGLKREDPRYLTAYVLNHIIGGGGLTSMLAEELRGKRGLTYGARSNLAPSDFSAEWSGGFSTQTEKAPEAVSVLKQTYSDIQKHGITQKQLDEAKSYLTGSFVLNLDSNRGLAQFLIVMQRYKLGADYLEKRNSLIEQITLDDINRLAKEWLTPDRMQLIAVGKGSI